MKSISILGIYVADLAFFGKSIPVAGETVLGENYVIGPGGKGSNQAVASAKAGGKTYFISKIGDDQYGQMALQMYKDTKVDSSNVIISREFATGVAGIFVSKQTGENAINVVPGAAGQITKNDIDLKNLYSHLKNSLPSYAMPIILRVKKEIEITGTFKHKKAD